MSNFDKISNLLAKVVDNNYDDSELNTLIRELIAFVRSYLLTKIALKKLHLPYSNISHDLVNDLAIDLIAPLFARNTQGDYIRLRQLYEYMDSNDYTESLMVRRSLTWAIEQEIINIWKTEDPFGWRIHRNIKLADCRNPKIKSVSFGDDKYFYHCDIDVYYHNINVLNHIDRDDMVQIIEKGIGLNKSTPEIIESILEHVVNDDEKNPYVAFNSIFKAFKEAYTSLNKFEHEQLEDQVYGGVDFPLKSDLLNDIKLYLDKILMTAKSDVKNNDYLINNFYKQVLLSYFNDLIYTGSTDTLTSYIEKIDEPEQEENLLRDKFKHYHRISYILKKTKNQLIDIL